MSIFEEIGTAISGFLGGETATPAEVTKEYRHGSFSPVREGALVKWYVDGKNYFYAVSEALSQAQHEIYIEDWWLSPQLYLRRPPANNEQYRLDKLLLKKAEQGVKIYVVMYKEMHPLTLDSRYSKEVLQSLHKNIVVQRHPDHGIDGTFFWAHHEKIVVVDRHIAFIGGLDLCFGRYDTGKHQLTDFAPDFNHVSVWPGQDYSNPRIKDFIEVNEWASVLVDKRYIARMPWHDISIGFVGKPALDVARHFIQRWNFIKKEKGENIPEYPVLIVKSDNQHERESPSRVKTYTSSGKSVQVHPDKGTCNIQILRSSSKWSHGLSETECSIQNAYIDTIKNAKHFVYIENQFFITATKTSDDYPVKNLIGEAIVNRILEAHNKKEQFRVIVAMPLLPCFPAELDSSEAGTLRLIMHYQYQSICRGGNSIIERLKKGGCTTPGRYIGFFALRTYDKFHSVKKPVGVLQEELSARNLIDPKFAESFAERDFSGAYVTEEVYIHTKVLIADDRIVICGSANLNDRSQNGDHDSEIAAIIEDRDYIESRMAGNSWQAGKFAATLRRAIFKEHLGLDVDKNHDEVTSLSHPPPIDLHGPQSYSQADEIVKDPVCDDFYFKHWLSTADSNTAIYREVFHCVPDDTVSNWDEFKAFVPNREKNPIGHAHDSVRSFDKLQQIKGHLVVFPLEFLVNEELGGSVIFDAITPMELFT